MKYILSIFLGIVICFFLINSYGSTTTILELTGVRARVWGSLFLLVFGYARLRLHVHLPKKVIVLSMILGITTLTTGISVGVWEYLTPDNYVYSLFRLQPYTLVFLAHGLGVVLLLSLSKRAREKYGIAIVSFLPLWFIFLSYWVTLLPFDRFVSFTKEDGVVEMGQFVIIFASAVLSALEALLARHKNTRTKTVMLALTALACFVIAFEEISWGQRIFQFKTPEKLALVNVQQETTIHNIGILNTLQYIGYVAISASGTVYGMRHILRNKRIGYGLPFVLPWYFIPSLVYYITFIFNKNIYPYAEIVEVLFYGGIFWWIYGFTEQARKAIVK